MAKNITYLLGAGASYHSIPVVDSLNDRMELFLNMATPHQKGDPIIDKTFYNELNLQSILQKYGNVMLQALKHRTVDTFAKKLFLQKNWDDLHILKEFLCLYFAFEQSPDDRKVVLPGQGFSHIAKEKLQSTLDGLHNHLDYRYDIFLAALLNDEMELPSNINIISWNYDHQFEMAYGDYAKCNFNVSKSKLKIYPHEKCDDGQIIKLNGSANQFILNDRIINFEHHESKRDFFLDTISQITSEKSYIDNGEYALHFAWEKKPIQKKAISLAKSIIEKTDELIIIGYSFPYFNRSVDIDILSNFNARTIKVQCLESDFKGIKQSLLDIWGEDISSQIHYHDDLSQFYIPSVQFYNNL